MFQRRMLILVGCFSLAFLGILGRLVDLQILRGQALRAQGEKRRHRLVQIPPVRGKITDRMGRPLAEDTRCYELWVVPAASERRKGRLTVVSLLGDNFPPARLMLIAGSEGKEQAHHRKLALQDLVAGSGLVQDLSLLLKQPRRQIAESILNASTRRMAGSEQALTTPRPCFERVSQAAYLAVRRGQLNAYADHPFAAIEPHLGTERRYPAGRVMGHITGYVGNLSDREYRVLRGDWSLPDPKPGILRHRGRTFFALSDLEGEDDTDDGETEYSILVRLGRRRGKPTMVPGYFANETVGRGGVEQHYNQHLRGRHALRLQRLERPDPEGPRSMVNVGRLRQARHGRPVTLTIDLSLQKRVEQILADAINHGIDWPARTDPKKRTACAVLLDPRNGSIYAMVSHPGYDPNHLSKNFSRLLNDPRAPLYNLVTQGQYPPGSVIKPIVALGALHDGLIDADTEFICEGEMLLGKHSYTCMSQHGPVNVLESLRRSCNVFFYEIGSKLRSKRLYHWAWHLSFGHHTEVDTAGEMPGQLPVSAQTGRGWATGHSYHFSIGQGPITVTPLQVAVAYAAIANGGRVVRPHVTVDSRLDLAQTRLSVRQDALDIVRRGMWEVVQEEDGTGKRAQIEGLEIAGKTGSAEHRKGRPTHAWFAGYAPFHTPEVVCVVLVPEGGYGGTTSAPIARQILEAFFNLQPDAGTTEGEAVG